ncbi:MAG: putative toxin, partial [Coriobacteriia bacterium]|nr:putative toxin [Coriobacteriia bacterium]
SGGLAGTYKITRSESATKNVDVATYHYNTVGRIDKVTDADGVGYTVAYDGSGRVLNVSTTASTPVVTTFTYTSSMVTVSRSAGALPAQVREISISSTLGNQATSVIAKDSGSATHPKVTYTYDEYGQPWKAASPSGQVSRSETDGRGNVVVTAEENASGAVLKTTEARYDRDHVVWQKDASGNISTFAYDVAWRPADSAATVSGNSGGSGAEVAGADTACSTYDSYGHITTQTNGSSTAYNLLRNGTFHLNPLTTGNGWDGTRVNAMYVTSSSDYLGGHVLSLTNGGYHISDEVAVKPTDVYTLSAWVSGKGSFLIHEYNASHTQIGSGTTVLVTEHSSGTPRRVAATYVPSSSSVAYIRVRPSAASVTALPFLVDNVAFVASARLTPDSLLENSAMERISNGHPQAWAPRGGTPATQDASTDAQVVGTKSAHIRTTTATNSMGYFYSDTIGVRPGEKYVAALSVKTVKSVGGAHALMRFTNSSGGVLSSNDVSVTAEPVMGTSAWRRHVVAFTVPAGAANVQMNLYHEYGGGDAYFDAATLSPLAGAVTTVYDPSNTFATSAISNTGAKTTSVYDGRGRATETSVTPAGAASALKTQAIIYDGLDRLTSMTVWTGTSTSATSTALFAYTNAGRLTSVTDPRGNKSYLTYNTAGQTASGTSATGIQTKTDYDALGRVLKTYVPAQNITPTTVLSEITYDGLSRPKTTTYKSTSGTTVATHTRTFDIESRVTVDTLAGSGVPSASAENTYDILGHLTKHWTSGPAGTISTEATYTVSDLPKKVTRSAFGTTWTEENTFAKTGDLLKMTVAGNTYAFSNAAPDLSSALSEYSYQTRTYDIYGRVGSLSVGTRNGSASNRLYDSFLTYDNRGRIGVSKIEGPASSDSYTDEYTYSNAAQLTQWKRVGFTSTTTFNYGYDKAGNVEQVSGTGLNTTTYTHDADNRLTAKSVAGVPAAATAYTNDIYGRRTQETSSAGSRTYSYNALGQLSNTSGGGKSAEYAYGIDGMREQKTVTEPGVPTKTIKSYYDGSELQAELDADGTRYTYVWGPEGTPLSLLVKPSNTPTETYSYHIDAGGSVIALTNTSSAVVAKYSYDPYGNPTFIGGANLTLANRNPLRYRSYYYDTESGNYYLPARYYNPDTMRFLTPDPAAASPGNPLTLNRYAYCLGDPVNLADRDGREPHGYNIPDGYGSDGYNYGHDGDHSSMQDAYARHRSRKRWEAKRDSLQREARKYERRAQAYTVAIEACRNTQVFLTVYAMALGGLYAAGFTGTEVICGRAAEATTNVAQAVAKTGGRGPVDVGKAGEAAVRNAVDIGDRTRFLVDGRTRISDGSILTTGKPGIVEIKNVASLSYTQQLRDSVSYATANGTGVDLYVRESTALSVGTKLSGPLQSAINIRTSR